MNVSMISPFWSLIICKVPAWCLVISDNHRFLASSSADNSIRIWDLTTGQPYHTFRNILYSKPSNQGRIILLFVRKIDPLCRLCFGSDSITLVSSSNDNTLKIWNLEQKALAHAFLNAHEGNEITIFTVSEGTDCLFQWKLDVIYSVSVERNHSNLLASCSADMSIKLWDIQKKANLKTISNAHEGNFSLWQSINCDLISRSNILRRYFPRREIFGFGLRWQIIEDLEFNELETSAPWKSDS